MQLTALLVRKALRSDWKFADLMLKNFWSLMCQGSALRIPSVKGFRSLNRTKTASPLGTGARR